MAQNQDHASKGYTVVTTTDATAKNFYGFTVVAAAVVTTIVAPTATAGGGPEGYDGHEAGIAALTSIPVGYYPVRGSSITLASGQVILWHE